MSDYSDSRAASVPTAGDTDGTSGEVEGMGGDTSSLSKEINAHKTDGTGGEVDGMGGEAEIASTTAAVDGVTSAGGAARSNRDATLSKAVATHDLDKIREALKSLEECATSVRDVKEPRHEFLPQAHSHVRGHV